MKRTIEQQRYMVAKWIMGWERYRFACEDWWAEPERPNAGMTRVLGPPCYKWHPEADREQAMQVAEVIRQKGYSYQIYAYSKDAISAYRHQYCFLLRDRPTVFEWADTLEEAVFSVALMVAEMLEKEGV